jgi:GTP-binding protein YchF
MSLKIGIVGLPNVGKSTLFNALTRSKAAQAANYPFCTIDPNVGVVEVPDQRLLELNKFQNTQKIIPASVEFVDIAGLVKGASQGEGLGNQFLAHIRECAAIAQVVRAFEDGDIIHVHGDVNPKRDMEIIEAELVLADLQTVEKRLEKAISQSKSGDKEKIAYAKTLEKVADGLKEFRMVSKQNLSEEELVAIKDLHLLTVKPLLYVVNLHEDHYHKFDPEEFRRALGLDEHNKIVPVCAKIEEELAGFSEEEAQEFLREMGMGESGLNSVIRHAYSALDLMTYFTVGEKEIRAWTLKRNSFAPQAAGVIHTDFEKGFIRAEVVAYEDFVKHGGALKSKEAGALRIEGKQYITQDGDIMHFRFS